ncbi:hymenoptaecin-like [Bombus terrestris]|uniref:Hymenoptaecin-like n=1 Tax=Bombus terrestris TaxID=30195 RepID=A0A9C6W022_BOMTE|nr:hymenoptaecin-like [Bombus terrestris]
MKFIVLALFCMAAYAAAQEIEPEAVEEYYGSPRFRRHADPQGSLVINGKKPLSGPDRRPSLDVDYHQRVYDRNGVNADAYGGLNIRPGQPAQPHLGVQIQREYKNGFIRGYSQAERGPGGRISPSFGVGGGFRFRRDVDDVMSEELGY